MNCERVREKLTITLAAGDPELSSELAVHVGSCDGCRLFYEMEAKLLRSIDDGLCAIVNLPVPTSLLPRVREHLEEFTSRRSWLPMLLPVSTVLVVAALLAMNSFKKESIPFSQSIVSVQPRVSEGIVATQLAPELPKTIGASPVLRRQLAEHSSEPQQTVVGTKSVAPEVLISPDESRGLRFLTSTVYREPAVGMAILNSTSPPSPDARPIAAQEIAPLQVAALEIRPLLVEDR